MLVIFHPSPNQEDIKRFLALFDKKDTLLVCKEHGFDMFKKYSRSNISDYELEVYYLNGDTLNLHSTYKFKELYLFFKEKRPEKVLLWYESYSRICLQLVLFKLVFGYKLVTFSFETKIEERLGNNFLYTVKRSLLAWVFNRIDTMLFASTLAKNEHEYLGFNGKGLVVGRPFAIDSNFEGRGPRSFTNKIGFVGRLVTEKGINDFEELAIRLPDYEFHVFGDTKDYECKNINNLTYHGFVNKSDVYSIIDILLVPSRTTRLWEEQFGKIIVEAAAHNTLVIGSDSGAIPEVIGDSRLVFREGDIQNMLDVVRNVVRDRENFEDSLEAIRQRFSVNNVYNQIKNSI